MEIDNLQDDIENLLESLRAVRDETRDLNASLRESVVHTDIATDLDLAVLYRDLYGAAGRLKLAIEAHLPGHLARLRSEAV